MFMNSVLAFKKKGSENRAKINVSLLGQGSFHGLMEYTQLLPLSMFTLKCNSI